MNAKDPEHRLAEAIGQKHSKRQRRKDRPHQQHHRTHVKTSPSAPEALQYDAACRIKVDAQTKVIVDDSDETSTKICAIASIERYPVSNDIPRFPLWNQHPAHTAIWAERHPRDHPGT
jgi:hypothetical protein